LGKRFDAIIITSRQTRSPLTIVTGGGETEVASTEDIARIPEAFCAAALDGSTSSDILQYKICQHANKLQYEEKKYLSTSTPSPSLAEPDELSFVKACLH
jgi:hypothetical protein